MRLRLDAVNAAGGIRGRKLRLVVEDHQFQVPRAVQAANKLINRDHVVAMVGNLGTAQVDAILPLLRKAGIPNLFPMAASRDLVQAKDSISWISGSLRSEEHTSELQSLMRISYAVFCLKKKTKNNRN